MAEQGAEIGRWVRERGASILVCGGLEMAAGVQDALIAILGEEKLDQMTQRRSVSARYLLAAALRLILLVIGRALGQMMQHQRRRLVGITGFQRRQYFQMIVDGAVHLVHRIIPLPDQEVAQLVLPLDRLAAWRGCRSSAPAVHGNRH